eukprot:720853-Amphidinium_carterae.1
MQKLRPSHSSHSSRPRPQNSSTTKAAAEQFLTAKSRGFQHVLSLFTKFTPWLRVNPRKANGFGPCVFVARSSTVVVLLRCGPRVYCVACVVRFWDTRWYEEGQSKDNCHIAHDTSVQQRLPEKQHHAPNDLVPSTKARCITFK